MEKRKRIAAIILAVTVMFVMIGSALFIAAEVDHDCIGENCPICFQINVCRNTLKTLSLAVCAAVFAVAFTYTLRVSISAHAETATGNSLVTLKVKLSD